MSSTLIPTLNFNEISKNDFPKAGTKGAYIGELTKAKIPVPQGFLVSSESYYYFLDMAKIREKILDILTNLDVENTKEFEEASNIIQDMIIKSPIPPAVENAIVKAYSRLSGLVNSYVAVRSSISYDDLPDDSFAGMSATFLNIKGTKDVVLAVKACWASLFEVNSIYYRAAKGISHIKVGMGVVVQRMIQSEVSGVMFTINPVDSNNSKIIIESILGLAEIVESDAITPDHYEIDKTSFKLLDKKISKQPVMIMRSTKHKENEEQLKKVAVAEKWQSVQKLDDRRINELASIGKLIEQHFGEPQDIEWAMEGGKLYIIQTSSLITKTPKKEIIEEIKYEEPVIEQAPITEEIKQPVQREVPQEAQVLVNNPEGQLIIAGSPASSGIARGIVKIVRNNDDFLKLNTGEILVIDKIIPDYILWMRKAGGIITNEGGMSSHSATLSREFGIPCVVDTENATEILSDNDEISLDGDTGKVYMIKESQEHPIIEQRLDEEKKEEVVEKEIVEPQPSIATENSFVDQTQVAPEVVEETEISTNLPEQIKDFELPKHEVMQVTYERDEEIQQPEEKKESFYAKGVKTATKVMVNLSNPENAASIAEREVDGIGFIDGTSIINKVLSKYPESFVEEENVEKYVNEMANVLASFAKDFNPNPVIYRPSNLITSSFDFDISQFESSEKNPKLGYNGAFKYIHTPYLFNMEIEAIKTARNKIGYKNISLMLPMVRDAKDLREIKKIITSNDLKRSSTFKIYLPIEAPSTVLLINELIDIGIDGVFIYLRGLSGFLNAVDLDNPKYKDFNIFNNALMNAAQTVIKTAHKYKILAGVVLEQGEFDEDALKKIIEWGTINISVDPFYFDKAKIMVSQIEKSIILSKLKK